VSIVVDVRRGLLHPVRDGGCSDKIYACQKLVRELLKKGGEVASFGDERKKNSNRQDAKEEEFRYGMMDNGLKR
jgi:hypothetical protein